MKKGWMGLALLVAILAVTTMFTNIPLSAKSADANPILTATEAEEWTALFDRRGQNTRTWLGADGIYSVALDGNDAMGSATDSTNTFFIFSDTLMGTSDENGQRIIKDAMPAQSSALLKGNTANADALSFVYGVKGSMNIGSHLFREHKWMLDCFVVGEKLYILGFPQQDWKPKQIDMITIPIENGEPIYKNYKETKNIEQLWYRDGDRYLYAYGIGVTANTKSAGAPNPDGYLYIYGYRDAMKEFSRKDLIVCRIHENDFPDFSNVTYWTGNGWGNNIEDSAVLLTDVSCEMSVTPITEGAYKGKYIAIYTQYTRSSNIMYAIGDSPTGPFDTPVKFYHAEEHGTVGASGKGTRVVYNAKAHPHLSTPTKLLVSYNVNVEGDGVEQWTTDYHPRFVWLDLDPYNEYVPPAETTAIAPVSSSSPETTNSPITSETPQTSSPPMTTTAPITQNTPETNAPPVTTSPETTQNQEKTPTKDKNSTLVIAFVTIGIAVSSLSLYLIKKKKK